MTPTVSILMTVRNEESHLPAALRSLQRQTLTDWELIVVDDGSDDATAQILATAAKQDDRIRVVSQPPRGIVPALNRGLPLCRSELIARMDGDDISHPRRLEQQVRYLYDHPQVDLVTCRVRYFPHDSISAGLRTYERWVNSLLTHELIMRDRFVESPLVQASVVLRRTALEAVGGYRENDWLEDYDLWLRMAEHGCRFARLPERLFFWRDHPIRVTRTHPSCSLEAFRDCKAHYLRRGVLKDVESVTLWGVGVEGKAWRKALERISIGVRRWVDIDPRKIGQTIHGAPVVTPAAIEPGSGPILITVGSRGVREEVRRRCQAQQLIEEIDYFFVT